MMVYLHGFASDANGSTAETFRQKAQAAGIEFYAPQISHKPVEAYAELDALFSYYASRDLPVTILASSLGAFYARHFANKYKFKCVLVNPCVDPSSIFAGRAGEYKNLSTGEAFTLTEADIDAFRDIPQLPDSTQITTIIALDDEVIPAMDMIKSFRVGNGYSCDMKIVTRGGHRFEDKDFVFDAAKQLYYQHIV